MKQSKPFLEKIRLRNHAYGEEQRVNMTKLILDHKPNFPLGVTYEDIDRAFFEWVDKDLELAFEDKKIPTFQLYSNQRINEYAQTWQHLDEVGNVLMNFKTVSREVNPKKGKSQGDVYNIPGNRDYPMFIVPTLQENGQEVYDMYTMKQPMSIDFDYTITLITNKFELLNMTNMLINDKFKALQAYISPNNHPMPMTLEDISDESEYAIDDRKYFSQTYKINVKGYIIKPEDFTVHRLPTRYNLKFGEIQTNHRKKKLGKEYYQVSEEITIKKKGKNIVTLTCETDENKIDMTFTASTSMNLTNIETSNIDTFILFVNDEYMDVENDEVIIYKDDIVKVFVDGNTENTHRVIKLIGEEIK